MVGPGRKIGNVRLTAKFSDLVWSNFGAPSANSPILMVVAFGPHKATHISFQVFCGHGERAG